MNVNFMTYMKSRQFSSNTMENYIRHINQFMNYIGKDETDITPFDIMNWMGEIGQVNTASSVHTKLESVKSYIILDLSILIRQKKLNRLNFIISQKII